MLKKIAGWAVVIFLGFYLVTQPVGAASTVHGVIGDLEGFANSLAVFVNHLGNS